MILSSTGFERAVFGRYRVEQELGRGAMSVVYLGSDTRNGRLAAIKTVALPRELASGESREMKERFLREAEVAGSLHHPHIVTIHDAGAERGLVYIAMEFLRGRDLTLVSEPGHLLPLPQAMSIVARVAAALSYAHAHGVVHCDIKPANIMYEPGSDAVKVTDFGFAHITGSCRTGSGMIGMVRGTPGYLSPEQLAGGEIEGRSDLFALGVVLYQLASGHLPFQGDSMALLMFKIACEPPVDILTYNPGLPPCLVDIINRALAKQPQRRFQTGDEMAQAVTECAKTFR